jgi:hypothetical protein
MSTIDKYMSPSKTGLEASLDPSAAVIRSIVCTTKWGQRECPGQIYMIPVSIYRDCLCMCVFTYSAFDTGIVPS